MTQSPDFILFGDAHLVSVALILALAAGIGPAARGDRRARLAWLMAVLLIAQEVVKLYVYIGIYGGPWKESLPLDLCRVNEFLCAYMLARRSYRAF